MRKFLFCDNGHKVDEVKLYAQCLRPGDLLGIHDWNTEINDAQVGHILKEFDEHEINKHLSKPGYSKTRFFIRRDYRGKYQLSTTYINISNMTVVIPVYNQYELLRQCVESILHQGILDEVAEIIIVDDYSDPSLKIKPYEDYIDAQSKALGLEKNEWNKIRVIKSDEYRVSVHAVGRHLELAQKRGDKELIGMNTKKTTRGHGYALQTGINEAKTDYVMCVDADCVFLKNSKGMIADIIKMFSENQDVICIGQLAGIMSNDNTTKINKAFKYSMHGRNVGFGGCPGSPAFFIRKNKKNIELKDDRLNPPENIAIKPIHRGWVLSAFVRDIFDNGYSVMNYPVFSQKKMFHVGGGILNAARFYGEAGKEQACWGMLKDGCDYGGRRGLECISDWYQGRYILNMTTREYMLTLEAKYDEPFNQLQPPLDEKLLYIAKEEVRPIVI